MHQVKLTLFVIAAALSVGPSLFHVTQTMITDVLYTDAYPYDTATFASAPTARARTTAAGFHLGADVTVKLSAHVGLGGLQAGGGVRIGF